MNGKPNKKQKDWHNWCRDSHRCVVGLGATDSIHHIKGARMRLKGVKGFAGEWYVIPLSYWWHQDEKNQAAVHTNKREFERATGMTEKEHWVRLVGIYEMDYGEKPMTEEEYQIIVDRA